ncbi:Carbonic anhydrase [Burkholderia lata]|uniref:carbonic anhydrase n=1 Tax=Burkholderia lata (strain ATCC 17760 / DSM 23089 / LMG 22485 / NCIMB 9086 / R18194 / 383) TaxID=482957 RepID=A0A6P2U4Z0_BURL3|nr:carbonic anhydrase family protein [Burkholderia lata]VWC71728.1 Carbonic anhydrase [Burkholderia lata]
MNLTKISALVAMTLCMLAATPITARAGGAPAPAHEDFDYDHQRDWHVESGDAQSPVTIAAKDTTHARVYRDENGAIVPHFDRVGAKVIDNGHTIQIVPDKFIGATIRGRHFTLKQIHFHAPAEHPIDGATYPVEGHFVFRSQDGRLAVVAVYYRIGAENAQFDSVMRAVRDKDEAAIGSFDATALLPDHLGTYYHYLGSLTTPPLTENVEWYVLAYPAELSAADIASFTMRYSHNARVAQPLNGRPLLRYDVKR